MMAGNRAPIRLVVFDLDGTITRGETVCEAIARRIGRLDRMREFEQLRDEAAIIAGRNEMLEWYRPYSIDQLCLALDDIPLAPGTDEAFRLLHERRILTAIASITWSFAVDRYAGRLGAQYVLGTTICENGIEHVWPADKARWLTELRTRLGIAREETAAIGDSWGDVPLLREAGIGYFVGQTLPEEISGIRHFPGADLAMIAEEILTIGAAKDSR